MSAHLRSCRLFVVLSLFAIVSLQILAYDRAVPSVAVQQFGKAQLLRSSRDWHYGYLLGHHGAFLVRTKAAGPLQTTPPDRCRDLQPEMASLLSSLPRKALLEGLFYYLLVLLALLAAIRLTGAYSSWRKRATVIAIGGVTGVALLFLFLAPMLVLGYGASAFSTWAGPGALSYSTGHPWLFTTPAETVSYRYAVELTLYASLRLVRSSQHASYADDSPEWLLVLDEFLPNSPRPTRLPPLLLYFGSAALLAFTLGCFAVSVLTRTEPNPLLQRTRASARR